MKSIKHKLIVSYGILFLGIFLVTTYISLTISQNNLTEMAHENLINKLVRFIFGKY